MINLFLFLSIILAQTQYQFQNSYQFFSKSLTANSLPIALNNKEDLKINFETNPFKKEFVFESLKAEFEIYYHNERYFSQQITIYYDSKPIALCTSYFTEQQNYLVPGACSGVVNDKLFGLTIYR